ncbi:MAG: polyisoprenyl-teichoic acid--peptidoglycan teichoic acid transferase [Actinomycetota bacterium]|jgi:LCP family protein required for cell wall assembly|nr:polyisoprenyl-teichoic acid--peptidoglycan teichoic acid transferase [Actinomycetota bacterium]
MTVTRATIGRRRRPRHPRLVTLMVAVSLVAGPAVLHGMAAPRPAVFEIHKVDEAHFNPVPGGVVFLLVLGNDARPGESISRADAIHLIGLNPSLGQASILDIPRDTYTAIPGHGTDKINAAHAYGGPTLMAEAVSALVGVDIPYVITTGFVGLAAMVDELGGVDVNVPTAMADPNSGAFFSAGAHHMTGEDALAFSRNRGISGGDFSRSRNQGILILAALAKLRGEGPSPANILRSLAVFFRHTTLDGLGLPELYRLGRLGLSIDPDTVNNVVMPGVAGSAGSASVVFPTAAADGVFADMRDDGLISA